MSVKPSTLTIRTALEARRSPPGEKCAICQDLLEDAPPEYSTISETESEPDRTGYAEAVITRICGDKHFFHRICIESWWKSADPNLNTCPVDRALCYGDKRIRQTPVNLPAHADFLNHNLHLDDLPMGYRRLFYTGPNYDQPVRMRLWSHSPTPAGPRPNPYRHGIPGGFRRLMYRGPLLDIPVTLDDREELDDEEDEEDENAMPGRAMEDVQAPLIREPGAADGR